MHDLLEFLFLAVTAESLDLEDRLRRLLLQHLLAVQALHLLVFTQFLRGHLRLLASLQLLLERAGRPESPVRSTSLAVKDFSDLERSPISRSRSGEFSGFQPIGILTGLGRAGAALAGVVNPRDPVSARGNFAFLSPNWSHL